MFTVIFLLLFAKSHANNVITYKTEASKISFTYTNGGSILDRAVSTSTQFAMNGEMYQVGNYAPVGLYIENSKLIHKATIINNPSTNYGINPQAVFYIDTNNKAGIVRVQNRNEKKYKYAVEISPMLLENGVVNEKLSTFKGKCKRRNGIGITKEGEVFLLLALKETTFSEFAQLFKDNGCISAAFVDGGVSEYWTPTRKDYGGQYGVILKSD